MDWLKKNIILIACLAGIIILALTSLSQCQRANDLKHDLESSYNFLEIEKKSAFNRDSLHVHEMKQMKQNLMSETAARLLLEEDYKRFKDIRNQVRVEMTTSIDTIYIPYETLDTVIINNYADVIPVDTVNKYFIQIPRKSKFEDGWMKLYTTIDTALIIDSMRFINKFDVTIGYKKPDKPLKFLRHKQPVVELTSFNPYTTINYINNIVVDDKKNPAKAMAVSGGVGFVVGFVTRHFIK